MPKKTLNEATVRQFMKLVNHKNSAIDNFINEQYNEEEQMEEGAEAEKMEEVAPPLPPEDEDADPVGGDAELGADTELDADAAAMDDVPPELDAAGEEGVGDSGEIDITPEMAQAVIELGEMLKGAMGSELGGEEPPMDEVPPELDAEPALDADPEMDAAPVDDEEEEAVMENEENVVQEVARRVAKRILKAKKAKKDLNEALGNK